MELRNRLDHMKQLPIRVQLLGVFIGMTMILTMVIAIAISQNYTLLEASDHNFDYFTQINTLYEKEELSGQLLSDYIRNSSSANLEALNQNLSETFSLIEEIKRESESMETVLQLRAIENVTESFEKNTKLIVNLKTGSEEWEEESKQKIYYKYQEALKMQSYFKKYTQALLNVSLTEKKTEIKLMASHNKNVQGIVLMVVALTITVSIIFYVMLANYITQPIRRLVEHSKEMSQGNLEVQVRQHVAPIEIEELIRRFSEMQMSIQHLVHDLKEKAKVEAKLAEKEVEQVKMQELLKQSQLARLQMQISPHFLFNTLNTISRMAMMEEAPKAYELIMALSKFLRYSLKTSKEAVPLAQEIDMIHQYLCILKCRMGDQLTYKIVNEREESLLEVPLFILQPLVENAYIHGFANLENEGMILVKIKERRGYTSLQVYDNGEGMPKETLEKIRRQVTLREIDLNQEKHIGIVNVCCRLNIMFNGRVKYHIYSSKHRGTLINIELEDKNRSI